MSFVRIYKKFYQLDYFQDSYTSQFMSPVFLSANSYVSLTGNSTGNLVEQGLPISQSEAGIYYAQITPELYQGDLEYQINWYVQYTTASTINTLSNKFLLNNQRTVQTITVELLN